MRKDRILRLLKKKMPDIEYEFVLDEFSGHGFYVEIRPWSKKDNGI